MRNEIIVLVMLALAGCVTSKSVSLPNGKMGYAINCPGAARDISDCMNKAAEVCGGAYDVIDRNSETSGGVVTPVGNGAMFVQGRHRTLIVACRAR